MKRSEVGVRSIAAPWKRDLKGHRACGLEPDPCVPQVPEAAAKKACCNEKGERGRDLQRHKSVLRSPPSVARTGPTRTEAIIESGDSGTRERNEPDSAADERGRQDDQCEGAGREADFMKPRDL